MKPQNGKIDKFFLSNEMKNAKNLPIVGSCDWDKSGSRDVGV